MTILTITLEISRTGKSLDHFKMSIPFSSIENMKNVYYDKNIIKLIIRDSKFTAVIAITRHSTVNGNMAKKKGKNGR